MPVAKKDAGCSQVVPSQQQCLGYKQVSCIKHIDGLVKHLSPYTGRISEGIAYSLNPFAHRKRITERCSFAFVSNVTVSINDVMMTSS